MKTMQRLLVGAAVVTVLVPAMSAVASAGEINGKGERPMVVSSFEVTDPETGETFTAHVLHAKSECAFSGLNDEFLAEQPEEGPASDGFGRTQNWGQIPKAVRDEIGPMGARPGDSCNPTKGAPVEP
jgi:hypothetical protein